MGGTITLSVVQPTAPMNAMNRSILGTIKANIKVTQIMADLNKVSMVE